jgi:hypothetical protein
LIEWGSLVTAHAKDASTRSEVVVGSKFGLTSSSDPSKSLYISFNATPNIDVLEFVLRRLLEDRTYLQIPDRQA